MKKFLWIFKIDIVRFRAIVFCTAFCLSALVLMNGTQVVDDKSLTLISEAMHDSSVYMIILYSAKVFFRLALFVYTVSVVVSLLYLIADIIYQKYFPKHHEKIYKARTELRPLKESFNDYVSGWLGAMLFLTYLSCNAPDMFHLTRDWFMFTFFVAGVGFIFTDVLPRKLGKNSSTQQAANNS